MPKSVLNACEVRADGRAPCAGAQPGHPGFREGAEGGSTPASGCVGARHVHNYRMHKDLVQLRLRTPEPQCPEPQVAYTPLPRRSETRPSCCVLRAISAILRFTMLCCAVAWQGLAFVEMRKGGCVFNGAIGEGFVVSKLTQDRYGSSTWSPPVFIKINQYGIGFTLGEILGEIVGSLEFGTLGAPQPLARGQVPRARWE